ncbi:MAG TPA: hemolysin family protein [Methylomirabilota bacterium]|nr:hemolysin family protein [Methylomirabilota bacterium]
MDSIWIEIVLIGVSILANAFFAGSEIALVSARPSRLNQLKSEGVAGAAGAVELKRDPDRFLATIQVAITVVGTLASAVGGAAAVEALTPRLQGSGLPGAEKWGGPVSLGLVVLVISFVSLVVGELTPKALALRNPERWAALVASPIGWLVQVLAGPSRVLTWATRLILTVVGLRDAPIAPIVSEEEVKYLVREGTVQGVFEPGERDLVNRVFQFTDTPVRLVMVPRPNILGLDIETPPDKVLERVAEVGHTRVPVYRGSIEGTVGVVVIKDLFRCAALGEPVSLQRLMHPPLFVPETAPVSEVLRQFQRRRLQLALVVDEYGQVGGLVTTEDLLEEIVGEIRDEGESPRLSSVSRLPDGSYMIDGTASIRDLREQVGLPLEESADYQTIAGFLLQRLGVVPVPGMTTEASGHRFTVVEMDGPRIMKVRAEAVKPPSP